MLCEYYDEITRVERIKEGDRIFDYNAMAEKILDVIGLLSNGSRDPLFTWLSNEEKSEAKKHLISIKSIPGPLTVLRA